MAFFVFAFTWIAYGLYVTSSEHLPKFDMEATNSLNNGQIVDELHPAFRRYDKVCLFSLSGGKNKDIAGCGTFEHSAIGLIKNGQCTLFSPFDINARIYFEYEAECREKVDGFKIKIFESDDERIVNTLVFVD